MKKITLLFFGLAGIFQAACAVAEEAGGESKEVMTFRGDWLPRLVNFAIIAAVVIYYMKKPVRDFFKNRTAMIAKAMQESKDTRDRAVAALTEMERKIKDLEAETKRLVAEAQTHGEKDRQALVEEGKKVAQDVHDQVKLGIEVEVQKAKTALTVEAALLALDLAEGRIKEKIADQDHERIVKEYISKMGGKA